MKLRYQRALGASVLVSTAPAVFAHGSASTVFHYFSSPDHLALFALAAVASVVALYGFVRRKHFQRRD